LAFCDQRGADSYHYGAVSYHGRTLGYRCFASFGLLVFDIDDFANTGCTGGFSPDRQLGPIPF
jgi:hypothetical protein